MMRAERSQAESERAEGLARRAGATMEAGA
jgi:hypothetical protein